MEGLEYWIWFSRIENLAPKKLLNLIEIFKSPKEIYFKTKEELKDFGINEKDAEKITKQEYKKDLDKYVEYMKLMIIILVFILLIIGQEHY